MIGWSNQRPFFGLDLSKNREDGWRRIDDRRGLIIANDLKTGLDIPSQTVRGYLGRVTPVETTTWALNLDIFWDSSG